ncbi:MAG TPA: acetyl-CoA hydrolase/transferase C-terminal domain-containing protein [Spirochaetota bacterium]|nr:acetyl-CoA hydrolase/transferase C-terminal domain-containing protein [Spirochaetota bacterium]
MNTAAQRKDRTKKPGSFMDDYRAKMINAEDAAALVRSNDRIFTGGGVNIPVAFSTALGARAGELENITIYQGFAMALYEYMKPEAKGTFNIETMFVGPLERICMSWGVGSYKPHSFSDLGEVAKKAAPNIIAFSATPPDSEGYVNKSCFGSFLPKKECLEPADTVICEINNHLPWCCGDDFKVHISEIDYIIENDAPIFELPEIPITDVENRMAQYIVDMIPDGSTIQLGFGGLGNAIGHMLYGKKDLGMHSEVVTPSVTELVKAGVITGARKNFYPGKIVTAFAVGTKQFYEDLGHNELFEFKEVHWVNQPTNIAQNDNMISINTSLMLDLTGQAASESIGTTQYSGTGGQVNFNQGAKFSKGGKRILAIASTYTDKEGNLRSKIMPTLPAGSIVTTSRNEQEYICTEYGVVNINFDCISDRVKKLISIAHPQFRDELTFEAKQAGWI